MSVCCSSGEQHLIFTKGAPESVLPRCTFAIDEEGSASAEMTPALRRDWERVIQEWGGDEALRCVALAYSAVQGNRGTLRPEDESDLVFLGLLGLQDPPRPEVADAVQTCGVAGVRVVMLTGATRRVVRTLCACRDHAQLLRRRTANGFASLGRDHTHYSNNLHKRASACVQVTTWRRRRRWQGRWESSARM